MPKIRQAQNPDSFPSQWDAQLQEAAAFGRNFVLRQRKANFLLEIDSLRVNPLGYDSDVKSPRSLAKGLLPGVNHLPCAVDSGGMRIVLFCFFLPFPLTLHSLLGRTSKAAPQSPLTTVKEKADT